MRSSESKGSSAVVGWALSIEPDTWRLRRLVQTPIAFPRVSVSLHEARLFREGILAGSLIAVVFIAAPARPSQIDPERGLDEPRALYRQGLFDETLTKLSNVIGQLREFEEKRLELADAHLLLGMPNIPIRDEASAKENFRRTAVATRSPLSRSAPVAMDTLCGGALIGAGAGALIGLAEGGDDCIGDGCYTQGENIAYGALGAGMIGALVGALYRTDRWLTVPSTDIAVGVNLSPQGAEVAMRFTF